MRHEREDRILTASGDGHGGEKAGKGECESKHLLYCLFKHIPAREQVFLAELQGTGINVPVLSTRAAVFSHDK